MAEDKTIDQILHADAKALGEDYLKYGGAALTFLYYDNNSQDPTDDLKIVNLRGLGNETAGAYSRLKLRYLPYFFIFQLPDGQQVVGSITAFYDPVEPVDPQHPELSAKDMKNWKFICQLLPGYQVGRPFYSPEDLKQPEVQDYLKYYFEKNEPMFPYLTIYATAPYLDPKDPNTVVFNPELVEVPDPKNPGKTIQVPAGQLSSVDPFQSVAAQLLQIKGNDVYSDPFWSHDINKRISQLGTKDENGNLITVIEVPLAPPDNVLPEKTQKNVFLFEVGVAQ